MEILALYDIHGNLAALDAVLADPRAARPDAVVIGGDAVPGPFARATLDRIDALDVPVHRVRGNGEREVAEAVGAPRTDPADEVAASAAHAAEQLGPDAASTLASWPLTVELDGVVFCHAGPRRDDELLTRLSPPDRWTAALAGIRAGLVVAGHTHQQDDRQVGAVRFVNAGSVGLPYEGDGGARWAWISDGVPHLRRTAYDSVRAGEELLASGWPGGDSIVASLIAPMPPDDIARIFEDRFAAQAGAG